MEPGLKLNWRLQYGSRNQLHQTRGKLEWLRHYPGSTQLRARRIDLDGFYYRTVSQRATRICHDQIPVVQTFANLGVGIRVNSNVN